MKIHAYAKINLTLDILGRRPDGYHDLVMVMQSVGLYDEVTVKLTDITGIKVTSSSALLKDDQSNTAYKAAKCFFEYANINDKGAEITMEKRIPMEAGLYAVSLRLHRPPDRRRQRGSRQHKRDQTMYS